MLWYYITVRIVLEKHFCLCSIGSKYIPGSYVLCKHHSSEIRYGEKTVQLPFLYTEVNNILEIPDINFWSKRTCKALTSFDGRVMPSVLFPKGIIYVVCQKMHWC